ncbi:unnamed protein product, partial [Allacma fusca]
MYPVKVPPLTTLTNPTQHQQPNQSNSHVVPLMSLNLEYINAIDRLINIPKANHMKRKTSKYFRFHKFPRRPHYYPDIPHPIPLMSLKLDPPPFYPFRGKSIHPHHPPDRSPDVIISTGLKISSSRCEKCSSVTRKVQESAGTSENTPVS